MPPARSCAALLEAAAQLLGVFRPGPLFRELIRIGIVPGEGGAWTLARAVGYSKAAELFLTGATLGPDEALHMGLVSKVVAADRLLDEAVTLAADRRQSRPRAAAHQAPAARSASSADR